MIELLTTPLLSAPLLTTTSFSITVGDISLFIAVFLSAWLVRFGVETAVRIQTMRGKIRKEQGQTLLQLSAYFVYLGALLLGLNVIGIPLSYFFVGSAALLVGVGFSLQQLFQDVVSGIVLLLDRNINMGDVVSTSEYKGKIVSVGIRTTQLLTIDNEFMIVPNSKILSSGLRNLSPSRGAVRFRIKVAVAYDTDVELARRTLIAAAHEHESVLQNPEATAIILDFGGNGYAMELRFWMTEIFYNENILSEIRYIIVRRFKEEGIVIPLPQTVVHFADGMPQK